MRILMIAPQPFFTPRGTPFSVLNRCRALAALGHRVDLVTYHLGQDVKVPGLTIIRTPKIPGVRSIRIGPSKSKVPLDLLLLLRAIWQLTWVRYDLVHTHEEAGAIGWLLCSLARVPHLYDMHSDLAQQLTNFGFGFSHPLVRFAAWLERRIVRSARAVIVICTDLEERALAYGTRQRPIVIENIPLDPPAEPDLVRSIRERYCPDGRQLVVYTGSLEPYQGMPLLLDAMVHVAHAEARLVVVGGREDQVLVFRQGAAERGLTGRVAFEGLRPPHEIPSYLAAADVLVSPRCSGTNTPLKIYSYLHAGRPIVATRILTHTQALDDEMAVLVQPNAYALAAGIDLVLEDKDLSARLAGAAVQLAGERYNPRVFLERTAQALASLEPVGMKPDLTVALELLMAMA